MSSFSEDVLSFKDSSLLFSRIKRRLKSFGILGLLDDNNFPEYVSNILEMLGISVYKEEDAIIKIENRSACLPKDFKQLYAAYKCNTVPDLSQRHLQNVSVFEYDITTQIYGKSNGCEIECDCDDKILEKVVLKQFVNDRYITNEYTRPTLLRLSPNVKGKYSDDCLNIYSSSDDEIGIKDGTIYTNFDTGVILLRYYAFPIDENGLPMIPDIYEVEQLIEAYILWQIFLDFWLVDDVPNALQKMQYLEQQYNIKLGEAKYILKLPKFSKLYNYIKNKKAINLLNYFSQIDKK